MDEQALYARRVDGCVDIGRRPQDAEQAQGHDDDQYGQAVFHRNRPAKTGASAVVALAKLPVKGRVPMTGYSRDQFGDGWETVAGCNTRDRTLRRDLTAKS